MIVSSFIIQANVITIVNYNRQTFIVQATVRPLFVAFSSLLVIVFLWSKVFDEWSVGGFGVASIK